MAVYFFDEKGQIDIDRAYGFAGLAVEAVADNGPGIVLSMVKIGQDQADGPDIDMAQGMAPDLPVHRADIGAGPAADAAQGLGKDRIPGQFQSTVIQEHDMKD